MQNNTYKTSKTRHYHYVLFASIFLITFWIQNHLFINWDVTWHIEAAKRMLHGDTYTKNIFDDNPPMVFWFYMPAVLIHKHLGISLIQCHILSVELTVLFSFFLCDICAKQGDLYKKASEIILFRYTLLYALLFIPAVLFGSREMLLTVFILPYVILMGETIANKQSNKCLRAFIGLWMGIGIAFNPFYILIPVFLELQYWFHIKRIAFWRSELITLTLFFLCYLISIKIFYSDYFSVIIPSFFVFSAGFNASFKTILFGFPTTVVIISSLLFIFARLTGYRKSWGTTLWLCTAASYLIYFANKKTWLFHYIPELVFACLLISTLLGHFLFSLRENKNSRIILICFSLSTVFTFTLLFTHLLTNGFTRFFNSQNVRWQLISYFNQQKKQATVYSLSASMHPLFTILDYTTLKPLVPWPGCWALPVIIQNEKKLSSKIPYEKILTYKHDLLSQVANDIATKKPRFVIVDTLNEREMPWNFRFNYVAFFNQDVLFHETWKHYQLQKMVGPYAIYGLKN